MDGYIYKKNKVEVLILLWYFSFLIAGMDLTELLDHKPDNKAMPS